jgi:hypothetical protein
MKIVDVRTLPMTEENTTEQELTQLIEELDILTLKSHFTDIMQASVEDDPNTELEVAA